jgi:ribonuclease HII
MFRIAAKMAAVRGSMENGGGERDAAPARAETAPASAGTVPALAGEPDAPGLAQAWSRTGAPAPADGGAGAARPGYAIEERLAAAGATCIAGVDEVGRGAWAGPVIVCAAVTDRSSPPDGLTDSKLLTPRRRAAIAERLAGWLTAYAFGAADPEEIDEVGMTEALRRAAVRALEALPVRPDAVILDGVHNFLGGRSSGGGRPWPVCTEVKADQRSVSVAAASVLAKVHRDALMAGLGCDEYGFGDNAGYPSPVHRRRCGGWARRRTTGSRGRTWTISPSGGTSRSTAPTSRASSP